MNGLFIVILNWNGWNDTEKCIDSVLKSDLHDEFTIVLVDNGSNSKEIKLIEDYCEKTFCRVLAFNKEVFLDGNLSLEREFVNESSVNKIILIKNNENLGFANGNNVALIYLEKLGVKYVLLLNNDTEVEEDALSKMYNFILNPPDKSCAAVVPQIRFFNPSNMIWNCGGSINWLGVRKYYYAGDNVNRIKINGSNKIDYGTGCALLLDISRTGILSDIFFFGEEDFELAYRLKNRGLSTYCLYDAVIYHKVGASRARISEQKMGNMVFHYSQRMANLETQLSRPVWYLSVLAHFLSTIRLLRKEPFFSIKKILNMWSDVLYNVKNIKKYEREDYIRIANKQY